MLTDMFVILTSVSYIWAAVGPWGYTLWNSRYQLLLDTCSWSVAKQRCTDDNSYLVIIDTEGEHDYLNSMMLEEETSAANQWWTGLREGGNDPLTRLFNWADGSLNERDHWFKGYTCSESDGGDDDDDDECDDDSSGISGEPTGGDCVAYRRKWTSPLAHTAVNYTWATETCSQNKQYICEENWYCGLHRFPSTRCSETFRSNHACRKSEYRLQGALSETLDARSRLECLAFCVRRKECGSINFNKESKSCEINDFTFGSPSPDADFEFWSGRSCS